MTGRDKFAPEEWALLTKAGTMVGHAIIISDKPRRAGKEQRVLRKAFARTAANYPGNELIAAVLPEAEREAKVRINAKTLFMQREVVTEGFMKGMASVGRILAKAEEREAREFKNWLLNIGEMTALAVRDEELANIGLPGDEISKIERRVLRRVAKELKLVPYVMDTDPVHSKGGGWGRRKSTSSEQK